SRTSGRHIHGHPHCAALNIRERYGNTIHENLSTRKRSRRFPLDHVPAFFLWFAGNLNCARIRANALDPIRCLFPEDRVLQSNPNTRPTNLGHSFVDASSNLHQLLRIFEHIVMFNNQSWSSEESIKSHIFTQRLTARFTQKERTVTISKHSRLHHLSEREAIGFAHGMRSRINCAIKIVRLNRCHGFCGKFTLRKNHDTITSQPRKLAMRPHAPLSDAKQPVQQFPVCRGEFTTHVVVAVKTESKPVRIFAEETHGSC